MRKYKIGIVVLLVAMGAGRAVAKADVAVADSAVVYNKLTLEECIEQAVTSNYGLQAAQYRTQQAENNVTPAPFMPTLSGTARHSQTEINRTLDDRAAHTLNAGLSLDWRIFDGLGMFATHRLQREQLTVSQLQMRQELETLVAEVMMQYYGLVSLHNQLELAQELIELSQLRYREAMDKAEIGSASGLEMRLAKIDLNADSSNLIRQEENLRVAYIEMNRLMNRGLEHNGYVQDSIEMRELLDKALLTERAGEDNVLILLARSGVRISEEDYKRIRADRFPTLDFGAGYTVSATDNPNFQGNYRNSNGLNWGFTLGINIFDGFQTNRRVRNARLDRSITQVSLRDTELAVQSDLDKLYINYINNLQLIDFERENAEVARFNLEAAMLRYRVGDLSGIDFRNIQQQYLSAVNRRINVLYQAKISEVQLLTLSGLFAF